MNIERDELEALYVKSYLNMMDADTIEEWEVCGCAVDDALDALTVFDQQRLQEISDATHNGTVGDCHAALKEAGIIQ